MKKLRKQFQGLYWRQMFVTAGMVLLTLLLLGASFFSLSYNYARGQKSEEIMAKARVMSQLSINYLENGRYMDIEDLRSDPDFQQLATFAAIVSDVHFMICDTEGHVLLTTDQTLEGKVITMPESMSREILEKGASARRDSLGGLYESRRFVVGVPAVNPETQEVVGEVYGVSTTSSLDSMWQGFIGLFFMTAFVVLMISFMASSITTMRQVQPIREMVQATRRYAEGDFDIRMNDYGRDDEIGELAASFNAMAESLQQTERQRREFIANISHELKTPMTTIAGFADGILDGTIPKDQEDKYLATIADETRRLSRLVRSMLDMSRLESTGEDLTRRREFDISEKIVSTMLSFEARANDKQLDVDLQLPEDSMQVLADPDAITRVLYNLMDNAVKFAAPGSTLCVSLWKSEGKAYVSVRDHGETIPPDDLPFIFDRFHKSDRSRSLDRDGVGLGLYLVKSILDAHGEDIAVTSRDGVTEFVFTLTLAKPAPKPTAKPESTGRRGGRKNS